LDTRFEPEDRVRVRTGYAPGRFRTPGYIQGKAGVVVAVHGEFRNPESLAHGGDGLPKRTLYLVRFNQEEVWEDYSGSNRDKLHVDLYDHWLEPA
jgi:nitrile hydratase